MPIKGRVLLITADDTLQKEITPSMAGHDFEITRAQNVRGGAIKLGTEEFKSVIADLATVPQNDRDVLAKIFKERGNFSLFFLHSMSTISPEILDSTGNPLPQPIRWLTWPLPNGFFDQVRVAERPTVFFVDPTLFHAKALQLTLPRAGIQFVLRETIQGLVELTQRLAEAPRPEVEVEKPKSFWARLGGKQEEAEAAVAFNPQRTVVALCQETFAQAEALDAKILAAVPNAVSYFVSSAEGARAVPGVQPVFLMRDHAARIAGILAMGDSPKAAEHKEKWRILMLDNDKTDLERLAQSLVGSGLYEVTTTLSGQEALKLASERGKFHLVVIGTALAYAELTGMEITRRLKDVDQHISVIFMVDGTLAKEALEAISLGIKTGIAGSLIKPVTETDLFFVVDEALRKRWLTEENARLLKENIEKKEQLESINSFQTRFFQTVAHDVKNPLTAILGYSEVLSLKLKNLPNELRSAAQIHSAAKALNFLISDLVDLAAIETGKLRINMEVLDLSTVVNEVRSRIQVVADQRKVVFNVVLPPALPMIDGDPNRLGQVVQNLCTNAVQYTKEGGKVTIEVEADAEKITVGVRDSGIGISKEDLPRVFERGFQTQEAQKMRKAGFGLGLKIAREIVNRHGGDIAVESEFGVGSRFYFWIPVKKPA